MQKTLVDVDDTSDYGSTFFEHTREILDFKCRPTTHGLEVKLAELKRTFPGDEIRACYEATHIGFSLQKLAPDPAVF